MAVIGSNFGQKATPGWVYNLRAKPEAETEQAFEAAAVFYGGYREYRQRASHREIEVFVLEPRPT